LKQLSKKHTPTKAAVLPADGLLAYFSHEMLSLEDQQDQAMALIAFFGCLRGCELSNIEIGHLDDLKDGIMVSVIRFKTTNKPMRFLVPSSLPELEVSPVAILTKYINLVKPWLEMKKLTRLWPRPNKNVFTSQFRGKNHVGQVAKKIARFLKLAPESYTGHSFRRSAATAAADAGISLINLKRFGGWKSDSVASSYVDDSLAITKSTADILLPSSNTKPIDICETIDIKVQGQSNEAIQITKNPASTEPSAERTSGSPNRSGNVVFNFYVNSK
jgi:integrase